MVEREAHAEAVKKSRHGIVAALLLLVVVFGALGVAYAFMGGDELVADLLGSGTDKPQMTVIPPKPRTGSIDATASADSTSTITDAKPPTADQAAMMYWEQVASQEQIGKLVRGEISGITIGTVTEGDSTASVRLTVTYKDSGTLSGTMVLRNYDDVWYFSSIARDGNSLTARTSTSGDAGVVATIVSQQAVNQAIPAGIINGGYKTIAITSTGMGSGTATIGISLSGGTSAATEGTITCVSKTINGEKMWFISSFAKG